MCLFCKVLPGFVVFLNTDMLSVQIAVVFVIDKPNGIRQCLHATPSYIALFRAMSSAPKVELCIED